MISTFNSWMLVAPLSLGVAIALAYFSVDNDILKQRKRISNCAWWVGTFVYFIIVSVVLAKMFIAESLLGMIEQLGGDQIEGVGDLARILFWIVAIAWAALVCFIAAFIRTRRIKQADCENSRTSSAKRRRRWHEYARRKQASHKPVGYGKHGEFRIINFKEASRAARVASPAQRKTPVQAQPGKPHDEQHVAEENSPLIVGGYLIEKWNDTNISYTDDDGQKRSITDYIPDGTCEFYVAICCDDDSVAPLFLGSGTKEEARENLKRYLREKNPTHVRQPSRTAVKGAAVANQ